jgi:hypothetical protein
MKIFIALFFCVLSAYSQTQGTNFLRLMFYNVENFFDTVSDPATNDDAFTPEGSMRWTQSRYIAKRNNIYRVIANVGEWDPPALVALCEIENRDVLEDLIKNTPLARFPYRIIHQDSPDQRGIDVALLYRGDYLTSISEEFIGVRFPNSNRNSRDILYATLPTRCMCLSITGPRVLAGNGNRSRGVCLQPRWCGTKLIRSLATIRWQILS